MIFKSCITEKTKAVIVVDLYGSMPEWDEIKKIAKLNNIMIIEDL
jgi:perosamine synthetase